MFAKLLSTLVALGFATTATAQQMPMPSAGTSPVSAAPKGVPLPAPPSAKQDSIKPTAVPSAASTKSENALPGVAPTAPANRTAAILNAPQASTKAVSPPVSSGSLSIKQVAEAQRLQLASETAQKLGLVNPAQQAPLPAVDLVKPYRAPKQYPKIEYVAGTVGEEKVGFRMPDGELLALEAGSYIQKWRIKNIVNGKVSLEIPLKQVSNKAGKKRKAKPAVTRTMVVGQSLK